MKRLLLGLTPRQATIVGCVFIVSSILALILVFYFRWRNKVEDGDEDN